MSKPKKFSIKIHPAGFLIFAAAFLFADSRRIIASSLALVLHEGAHLIVMYLCGMRECTVEITPFGGMADVRAFECFSPWRRMLAAAAGLAASAAAAWICFAFTVRTLFWYAFFQANLSLFIVNLLPAWPLDGARILAAFASVFGWEARAEACLSFITILLGSILAILGLGAAWNGIMNPSLLVCGPYLCYAACNGRVSEKIRRLTTAERKLEHDVIMPVTLWAASSKNAEQKLGTILAREGNGRFHVLLRIEKTSGQIEKCWTETQWIRNAFCKEENDGSVWIDKWRDL